MSFVCTRVSSACMGMIHLLESSCVCDGHAFGTSQVYHAAVAGYAQLARTSHEPWIKLIVQFYRRFFADFRKTCIRRTSERRRNWFIARCTISYVTQFPVKRFSIYSRGKQRLKGSTKAEWTKNEMYLNSWVSPAAYLNELNERMEKMVKSEFRRVRNSHRLKLCAHQRNMWIKNKLYAGIISFVPSNVSLMQFTLASNQHQNMKRLRAARPCVCAHSAETAMLTARGWANSQVWINISLASDDRRLNEWTSKRKSATQPGRCRMRASEWARSWRRATSARRMYE